MSEQNLPTVDENDAFEDVMITASITRHYGAVSIGFTIERQIEVRRPSDILRGNNVLLDILDAQIDDFEKNRLSKLPVPQVTGKTIANDIKGAPAPKWVPAKEIYVQFRDGKKYWTIRPCEGNYVKYGASVYFDRMKGLTEETALTLVNIQNNFAHQFPAGTMVLIEIFNGKPRAIGLAHKDEIGV